MDYTTYLKECKCGTIFLTPIGSPIDICMDCWEKRDKSDCKKITTEKEFIEIFGNTKGDLQ